MGGQIEPRDSYNAATTPIVITSDYAAQTEYMLVLYGAGSYTAYVAASAADAATNGLIIGVGQAYISGPYESLPYLYAASTTAVLVTVVGYDGPTGMRFQHTNLTSTTTALSTIDTVVDAILVDTATTIPGTITTLQADATAILLDTGTTIPGTITTLNTAVVTTIPTLIGTPVADLATDIGGVQTDTTAILLDTGTTIPGTITALQADLDTLTALTPGWNYVYTPVTDSAGWTTPDTIFTVTGDVVVKCIGICTESFTTSDAITLELGIAGATAAIIAQIADATGLLINKTWYDATPTDSLIAEATLSGYRIAGGADIILTSAGTFTAGIVQFMCWWLPLSATGNVVSAL